MTDRPILFNAPMVRAIIDGTKTQTRRVIKPQPIEIAPRYLEREYRKGLHEGAPVKDAHWWFNCPYGAPGDRLWVRETWGVDAPLAEVRAAREDVMGGSFGASVYFRADEVHEGTGLTWRPSIHMPRWASRLTLEVVSVRVERVQDISEADAQREGIRQWDDCPNWPRIAFEQLWDSINAARGYGWDSNPWVWVVEFRRV